MKDSDYYPEQLVRNYFRNKDEKFMGAMFARNSGFRWSRWEKILWNITSILAAAFALGMYSNLVMIMVQGEYNVIVTRASISLLIPLFVIWVFWLNSHEDGYMHDRAWDKFVTDATIFYTKFGIRLNEVYEAIVGEVRSQMQVKASSRNRSALRPLYDEAYPFLGEAISYKSLNWE